MVPARGQAVVPLGIAVVVPSGTYGRLISSSGLALTKGVEVGAGVVDADYRGEVSVLLFNRTEQPFIVAEGDRVTQLIVERICEVQIVEDDFAVAETGGVGPGFIPNDAVSDTPRVSRFTRHPPIQVEPPLPPLRHLWSKLTRCSKADGHTSQREQPLQYPKAPPLDHVLEPSP